MANTTTTTTAATAATTTNNNNNSSNNSIQFNLICVCLRADIAGQRPTTKLARVYRSTQNNKE
jgi:hypothetical protein